MYKELLEIRDRIDGLLECYVNGPSFKKVGEIYGERRSNYILYLSPKETEKELNWYNAMEYCKSLEGTLPTLGELQFLYDNCKEEFQPTFYWSSSQDSDTLSWLMGFYAGYKYQNFKISLSRVRPIRRVYI